MHLSLNLFEFFWVVDTILHDYLNHCNSKILLKIKAVGHISRISTYLYSQESLAFDLDFDLHCATKGNGKKSRNASRSPVQVSGVKATSPESVAKVSVVAKGSVGREVEGSICKEVTGGVGNGSIEKKNSQKKEKGVAGSSEWSMVSPAKSGRSLFISTQKEEVEISASKFSVLSVDETEEGELIEEKLLTDVIYTLRFRSGWFYVTIEDGIKVVGPTETEDRFAWFYVPIEDVTKAIDFGWFIAK
ncbi:hypothetical protein HID58_049151 [Brassica napus]|uniref:Uncharacterized protein n=1 Tax=Brassica napus TaxID=3708 RepID=A0ABQ8B4B4_BRANA|nr:hypothetical protein HID58_049151 [Brassica napus]